MTKEEIKVAINEIGINYRGIVINQCIYLERNMDAYIATYVSKSENKQIEILELLVDRLTFEHKRQVLRKILEKKEIKGGFIKTKSNKYACSGILEDIRRIILERNYFAHYLINVFDSGIEKFPDSIGFIEYRDSTTVKWYSKSDFDDLTKRIDLDEVFELNNV